MLAGARHQCPRVNQNNIKWMGCEGGACSFWSASPAFLITASSCAAGWPAGVAFDGTSAL